LSPQIALAALSFGHLHCLFGRVQSLAAWPDWLIDACLNEFGNADAVFFALFVSIALRIGHASGSLFLQ
jgi:hypothetical protein